MATRNRKANTRTQMAESDKPRYELTEPAYIGDVLYQGGEEIEFDGIPGPHMEPLNEAADKMVEQHAAAMITHDPIKSLTIVGDGATVLQPTHNQG